MKGGVKRLCVPQDKADLHEASIPKYYWIQRCPQMLSVHAKKSFIEPSWPFDFAWKYTGSIDPHFGQFL